MAPHSSTLAIFSCYKCDFIRFYNISTKEGNHLINIRFKRIRKSLISLIFSLKPC